MEQSENYTEEPQHWGLVTVNSPGHPLHLETLYYDDNDIMEEDGEIGAVCIAGVLGQASYYILPFHILRPATELEVARFAKRHGSFGNLAPDAVQTLDVYDYKSAGPNKP